MADRLNVFTQWLVDYCDRPVSPALVQMVEARPGLSVSDILTLGHAFALTSVTGAVRGIQQASNTRDAPDDMAVLEKTKDAGSRAGL